MNNETNFPLMRLMNRVKTFEDACNETGESPDDKKFNSGDPYYDAIHRLEVWAKALNEGVILSYLNPNQEKWYPVHMYDGRAVLQLSHSDCTHSLTYLTGGIRLNVKSKELSDYMGRQCLSDYANIYT